MSIETRSNQYGLLFGRWQIQQLLGTGSGGQSAVFKLRRKDSDLDAYSALKVVSLIEERGQRDTFSQLRKNEYDAAADLHKKEAEQEVRLMEQLRGKTNIVDYLDYCFVDWSDSSGFGLDLLIRMELLNDLRNDIRRGKIFCEQEVIKVGLDICEALNICHRKNILHRDIKPENIFYNKDGDYKLGDFGISRIMTATPSAMASTGIGTPEYAAPEQVSGKYNWLVDIYSLGLVLYELGNGNRLPFASSSYVRPDEVQKRNLGIPLPRPAGVSDALADVILKACAFKPEDRYQSAWEFKRALSRLENQAEVPVSTPAAVFGKVEEKSPYKTVPSAQQENYATAPAGIADSYSTSPATAADSYATAPAGMAEGYVTQPAQSREIPGGYTTQPAQTQTDPYTTAFAKSEVKKAVVTEEPKKTPVQWKKYVPVGAAAAALLLALIIGPKIMGGDKEETEESQPTETTVAVETTIDPAEVEYQDTVAYCADLEAQGSLETAVQVLRDKSAQENPDIRYHGLLLEYEEKLKASTLDSAAAQAEQGQYKEAVQTIKDVQDTYDCEEFFSTISEYRTHLTRPLTDCAPLGDTNVPGSTTDVAVGTWRDCFGMEHTDSIKFWIAKVSGWQASEYAIYSLSGKYETLSGTIVAGEKSAHNAQMQIRIYLDGSLAYESDPVWHGSDPVTFEVNVHGVKEVRVECVTESASFGYCLLDAEVSEV